MTPSVLRAPRYIAGTRGMTRASRRTELAPWVFSVPEEIRRGVGHVGQLQQGLRMTASQ
jgi:hypothetical protein